jgi:hypothetical protein
MHLAPAILAILRHQVEAGVVWTGLVAGRKVHGMAELGQADLGESTIWTERFIGLFAAVALVGCLILFFGISGISVSALVAVDFTPGNRATLLAYVGLLVICLVALRMTRDRWQHAGLVLQVGSAISAIAAVILSLQPGSATATPTFLLIVTSLAIGSTVLNLPSLVYLSYGIAEWQPSDRKFLLLQILLTLVVGTLMLLGLDALREVYPPEILTIYCSVAAVMVMLARPACWMAQPLITLCLTAGRLASLLYNAFLFRHLLVMPAVARFQVLYGLNLGATVLFILGILLLAQIARVQRPAV